MISSLKRQGLYEVSIGLGKEYYENENYQINDGDGAFGAISLALSPGLRYLTESGEYAKDLCKKLDKTFGKNNEIALWREHPTPQDFLIQNYQHILSLMNLFKMVKKQNLLHSQFKLK